MSFCKRFQEVEAKISFPWNFFYFSAEFYKRKQKNRHIS